jgi:outer membrane receptor protein involved in Fe transport
MRLCPLLGFLIGILAVTQNAAAQKSSSMDDEEEKVVELEAFEVLGSRIRMTEVTGPSPVNVYGKEEISQTGAMTLADFLNRLPQNYNGISSGRGSTPNELNPEFGSRTETSTPPINLATGAVAPPANATGQSGVSLRGLGSGATLVLIDGKRMAKSSVGNQGTDSRQGYVDLNSIPLGMVESVEVITDGASALYGADAVAGVINIVLKKNWSGTELNSTYKAAFEGSAGAERTVSLVHGFSRGSLRGTVSLDYYKRDALKASDREYSAGQDNSDVIKAYDNETGEPVYGTNYLLRWGYPATVQARSGNLNGVLDPNGNPTRVALTPEGLSSPPTTTDGFIGVAPSPSFPLANAVNARQGNSSEFLDLIPPSERRGVGLRLTYQMPQDMEVYGNLLYTESRSSSTGQPPAFQASATTGFGKVSTIVPADYNPFGQDVFVGMMVYEFGGVVQNVESDSMNTSIGVTAPIGTTWRWDLSANWQQQDFSRSTRDFNQSYVTEALANPDPELRINPFTDVRAEGAPDQSALWEAMARYILFDADSEQFSADFIADGELFDFRGDAIRMATGLSYEDIKVFNRSVTPSLELEPVDTVTETEGETTGVAVFAELMVPIYGKSNARAGIERLDFQAALRHEDRGDAGNATVPKLSLSWAPVKSLLFRGGYSEGFRAPDPTEVMAGNRSFTQPQIVDPKRGDTVTRSILVTRDANPDLQPETSTSIYLGLLYEPAWLPGFTIDVNYYETEQEDIIQLLSSQVLVNNEDSFPGRVTRAEPDEDDIANGWPGEVTGINASLLNFGRSENHSLDFNAQYQMPETPIGRFQFALSVTHTLESIREVQPGVDAVNDLGDTFSPPKWRYNASVYWNYGNFNASVFLNYISQFTSNSAGNFRSNLPIPSQMKVDIRVGYEFSDNFIGNWGAGARISFGIGNLFDEEPPFADTVYGYSGTFHSPLGRNYQLAVTLPF